MGHVHIGGEVLHVLVQYDSLTVHETEGDTVAGFIRASIKGDVVVLLQSCLFYLFLEVGVVSFVQYGDATFRCDPAEVIC